MKRNKRTFTPIAACVITAALLSGCGAEIKQDTPMDTRSNPRVEAATAAFGPGFDYMIVGSGTLLADTLFVNFFQPGNESDLSRQLFNQIVKAESEKKPFMVTGERARKTAFIIIEALSLAPENGLPNLELLYLGDEEYVRGIEESVKRVGGKMRFAPYAG